MPCFYFIGNVIWNPPTGALTGINDAIFNWFYSNGCNYCHTQYVRMEDTGMGPVSEAGDYVFDEPLIPGSERTGPDLFCLGRKRSEQWEIDHLAGPPDSRD